MSLELYSQRKKSPCKGLIYNEIKTPCRIQIINIITFFLESNQIDKYAKEHVWPTLHKILKDEHGTDNLYQELMDRMLGMYVDPFQEVKGYLLGLLDFDKLLDTIELIFRMVSNAEDLFLKSGYKLNNYPPSSAVEDLNNRLAQHCIGFKFENHMIIKIDNELLYKTITKELIIFLSNPLYYNINKEYLKAHTHYRDGNNEDSILWAAKAYESTLKIICDKKNYPYPSNATATPLLKIIYDNKFIPEYLQTNLNALRSVLGDGVTVIRNKTSSHGKGSESINVNEELAAFALNSTGSSIKFLLALLEK
ncbi:STM4504/CBY_0614 family protein [Chitinophagaceae bacterium LWZ2-11]